MHSQTGLSSGPLKSPAMIIGTSRCLKHYKNYENLGDDKLKLCLYKYMQTRERVWENLKVYVNQSRR